MKKKRINVNLPDNVIHAIRERMYQERYSLREKSKWLSEAIEDFLQLKEYHALVEMAELVEQLAKPETIYISLELEEKLNIAMIAIRKKYPMLEGVKSLIVRASIVRRLVLKSRMK